jgi:hypothetical protein
MTKTNIRNLTPSILCVFLIALVSVAPFFPCRAAEFATNRVAIRIDGARVIHEMAGGIGASWHAIEAPINTLKVEKGGLGSFPDAASDELDSPLKL